MMSHIQPEGPSSRGSLTQHRTCTQSALAAGDAAANDRLVSDLLAVGANVVRLHATQANGGWRMRVISQPGDLAVWYMASPNQQSVAYGWIGVSRQSASQVRSRSPTGSPGTLAGFGSSHHRNQLRYTWS